MVAAPALLGVDVGGTFTDAVLFWRGAVFRAKVLTTADQSEGVLEAARRAMATAGIEAAQIGYFAHGMTTATNALLERKGARTATITTEGFRDLLETGRQNRPRLYDLCPQRPEPLVPRQLRVTAGERVAPEGEIRPLTAAEAGRVAAELKALAPESIAVCLLFSFLDPAHEELLRETLARELPGVHVSLSSSILPQFREYERLSTTTIDAYLTPVVGRYLQRLADQAQGAGLPAPDIMQSSGGLLPLTKAAGGAAPLVLSGPAAGVVGAIFGAGRSQVDNVMAFDMGGTSTDVTLVQNGSAHVTADYTIDGTPLALPMVDIHTIGAGGGSIAWIDSGGALQVGPQSAGAEPGPAAYGRGGSEATVTDANLCLGYLGDRLGSGMPLDRAAAVMAMEQLASRLGMSVEEASHGVRRVANAGMVKALRVISVERGHDPRRFVLVAFGGAGPMHGADLADELGISRVLVPNSCGVLSALGMVVGDQRRDFSRTVYSAAGWDSRLLANAFDRMEEEALRELPGAVLTRSADLRYKGQSHELTVNVEPPYDEAAVGEAFAAAHEAAYGYRAGGERVELVNVRLSATLSSPGAGAKISGREVQVRAADAQEQVGGPGRPSARPAWFDGLWQEAAVWQRSTLGASIVSGPAVIEEAEATTVVPPGWLASLDNKNNLWLKKSDGAEADATGGGPDGTA